VAVLIIAMDSRPGCPERKNYTAFMLQRTMKWSPTMTFPISDIVDRIALTFGQLAMLAALPVAAVAIFVHSI
jgi:hypothetical protein